jgi:hypothetical protein
VKFLFFPKFPSSLRELCALCGFILFLSAFVVKSSSSEAGVNVYNQLLKKFTAWAQSRDDIRAVILVGSRARSDHPADEWSDLDLMIYSNQPEQYLTRMDWMA